MKHILLFMATGFGSGNLPKAPGTWGSLLALIVAYFIKISFPLVFVSIIIGLYICHKAEIYLNEHDSPRIVWDEIVGVWLSVLYVPLNLYPLAFVLFRFFDITKIFPINKLQELPGGIGIMADDVVAGLFTRGIIAVVINIIY